MLFTLVSIILVWFGMWVASAGLVKDGDLILLIDRILEMRGRETVRVTKVKGMLMRARFGKVGFASSIAWGTMRLMRLLTLDDGESTFLFLMLFRVVWLIMMMVTVPHLIRWSGLLVRSPRCVGSCHAAWPCTPLWTQDWVNLPSTAITAGDVGAWPYSVGLLVKWVTFLGTLHWPAAGADLGVSGVSHVEMLILYALWAGERLVLEKALPRYRRLGRPISVSAVLMFGATAGSSVPLSGLYMCLAWWYW